MSGPSSWDDDDSAPALSEDDEEPRTSASEAGGFFRGERYERRGLLGVGGMGKVYSSKDKHLRREVALKEANSPELGARMAREARITAQLEHPGIVAVYDAGLTEDGRPWYTMRLIRGRTLYERLQQAASLQDRLRLVDRFHAACQAVAYAHSMGLVHRDLKPANIMVGEFGETQVADWGLARPVPAREAEWSRIAGDLPPAGVAGTRRYMSPEQIQGSAAAETSDVWSLGVTLLELLTGQRSQNRSIEDLPEAVPAELAAIVAKCLRPDPRQRYPSAFELSQDLGRYLDGRRVEAHEYSPGELFVRLVRAWKAPLAVGTLALAVLAVVLVGAGQSMTEERATARRNLSQALTQQALIALAADRIPEAEVLAAHALVLGHSPQARGVLAGTSGPRPRLLRRSPLPKACTDDPRMSADGRHLACVAGGALELWEVEGDRVWVKELPVEGNLSWHEDHIFLSTSSGTLTRIDLDGHLEERAIAEVGVIQMAYFGDLAVAAGLDSAIPLMPERGEAFPICSIRRPTMMQTRERLVLACEDQVLRTYSPTGELLNEMALDEHPAYSAHRLQPDGSILIGTLFGEVLRLATDEPAITQRLGGFDGSVLSQTEVPGTPYALVRGERGGPRIWDTALNAWVGTLPSGAKRIAPGPEVGQAWLLGEELELWELPEGLRPRQTFTGAGVSNIKVSPDGQQVAVAMGSGLVQLHQLSTGRLLDSWRWQGGVTKCVAFGTEDLLLAYGMEGPTSRLSEGGVVEGLPLIGRFRRCGRFSDGQVWGVTWGPQISRIDLVTGEAVTTRTDGTYFDASSSPSGDVMSALDSNGRVLIWGRGVEEQREHVDAVGVDVGDGGAPLVIIERHRLCVDERCVASDKRFIDVAVSARGQAAVSTLSGDVLLYDLATLELLAVPQGHSKRVASLDFSPDGGVLVTGGWDDSWRSWELSQLSVDPATLLAEAEAAWQMSLEDALR